MAGRFLRREDVGDDWSYSPRLGTRIDFWMVDTGAPGALRVYGSTAADLSGSILEETFEAGEITIEEALEVHDLTRHRDDLRSATRRAVQDFIAEMRSDG